MEKKPKKRGRKSKKEKEELLKKQKEQGIVPKKIPKKRGRKPKGGKIIQSKNIINAVNNNDSYSLIEMLNDLQSGIWSELRTYSAITVYRRNLQKAYIERMDYLINKKQSEIKGIEKYTLKRKKINLGNIGILIKTLLLLKLID